jgi:4'-phosphopantetheinyl transferase EntD
MRETFSITRLVPRAAAAIEIVGSYPVGALLPEEEIALGDVSASRRQEFALGRLCARQAMQKLGLAPLPILPGPNREPLWPPGISGSITHCDGYAAAAVTRKTDICSIGIDAERIQDFGDAVLDIVALEAEQAWLKQADRQAPWRVLLFSAKESVFKAWFQVFRTGLGFEHVHIDFHPTKYAFHAIVFHDTFGTPNTVEFNGRFRFDRERVLTSAFLLLHPTPASRCRLRSEIMTAHEAVDLMEVTSITHQKI